ncbi:amino acid transporter [Microbacterium arborescens]|uniref:amino acid transporter n=1 Tax=Microbacterium arborescens TaxID=33883 RepID=UPI003C78859B
MSGEHPTRREIMRPVQLLGLAFVAAVFSGVITLVSMGAFQAIPREAVERAVVVALVVAGIAFIATLVIIALLMLAVDPAQVSKRVDRPVLYPDESETPDDSASGSSPSSPQR